MIIYIYIRFEFHSIWIKQQSGRWKSTYKNFTPQYTTQKRSNNHGTAMCVYVWCNFGFATIPKLKWVQMHLKYITYLQYWVWFLRTKFLSEFVHVVLYDHNRINWERFPHIAYVRSCHMLREWVCNGMKWFWGKITTANKTRKITNK